MLPTPAISPINLDDLAGMSEERVLAVMAMLGPQSFEQGDYELDERIYPVPELIRQGFVRAAFEAPALGYGAWDRDSAGMCGADLLAARRDEKALLRFLSENPVGDLPPQWISNIYGKLWLSCSRLRQLEALEWIGAKNPAPLEAWDTDALRIAGPDIFSSVAKHARSMDDLPPDAFFLAVLHGRPQDLSQLLSLPDFKEKMKDKRCPWAGAAENFRASELSALLSVDMPRNGWRIFFWRDSGDATPFSALARSKHFSPSSWLPLAEILETAGFEPSSCDLDEALRRGSMGHGLADWLEHRGALPSKESPLLHFHGAIPTTTTSCPLDHSRLVKWMLSGSIDIFDGLLSDAQMRATESWGRQFIASCARAPLPERTARCRELLMCMAASKKWNPLDPLIVEALLPSTRTYWAPIAHLDAADIAKALGGYPTGSSSREAKISWWDAAILGESLGEPTEKRSKAPRL